MFGSIKPTPPSSTSLSSSLILLLLVGGVGAAALLKGKTAGPVAASKDEAAKEEKRRARTEEPVVLPSSTERLQPKPDKETPSLPSAHPIPASSVKEESKTQEMPTKSTTPPKALIPFPGPEAELKYEKKNKVKNESESETRIEVEIRKEKAKEEESEPVLKENAMEGPAKKTRIVPEIIVSPEVSKEVSPEIAIESAPIQMEAESLKESFPTEQSTKPPVKTKFEDLPINLTTGDELEEVDYITKIKTFKITRWPKTHTADLVQHGPDSLLSVLLPLKLQVTVERILPLCQF